MLPLPCALLGLMMHASVPLVCVLLVERTPCVVLAGEAGTMWSVYGKEFLVGGIGALNYESAVK